MTEIEQLYHNDMGVAFHWIKEGVVLKDKVQIVFKETGIYLSLKEIKQFAGIIDATCNEVKCASCRYNGCHKFLLKTPLKQLDLAVCKNELMQIKDLVQGTLFYAQLTDYLDNIFRN